MEENKLKTRNKEISFATSEPKEMAGRYLAENARREWEEQFINEDTGELVKVNRCEIVMSRGTFLSPENISSLDFYIQSGDIKSVVVSNIKRTGDSVELNKDAIWKMIVSNGKGKKSKYILFAQTLDQAVRIAKDYLEQTMEGSFFIESCARFSSCIVIKEDNLKKVAADVEGNLVAETDVCTRTEFYNITTVVKTPEITQEITWLVTATSVDDAKVKISRYIDNLVHDDGSRTAWENYELTVISGTCSSVDMVIPKEFSEAYFEWEDTEKVLKDSDRIQKAFEKYLNQKAN